ncbi:hypothetical protein A2U01_0031556 [Trifolium medium]|uniref:Uncharacterized protein n=1 Tax=Trifolium medium TaxID=97028 RepID=A0A392PEC9_9FABA|nr:hypothetical protein [Trifolium medium]
MRMMLKNEDLFRTFMFEEGCFGEAVDEEYLSIYYGPFELAKDHGLRGAFITIPRDPGEVEGGCVPAGAPTLNPERWAKALDGINGHQVAAEKRLKSHDEQLMLIIPVVERYSMWRYCDR